MSGNGTTPATREDLDRLEEKLLEAVRDVETHLLNAFYGFAKPTQKHFTELDHA